MFLTPWRVAAAGSAALGAVGLAVSDLWRLRTGKPQGVTIDRHAAAASLRSNTYVLQNGKKPVSWDPLAGHYPTRDGRIMFLHTNHPHHRAGALRITGAKAETREALAERRRRAGTGSPSSRRSPTAAASAAWCAAARNGMPIRTGIAVAKLPLIDIVQIGEAPPRPLPPFNKSEPRAAERRARASTSRACWPGRPAAACWPRTAPTSCTSPPLTCPIGPRS